MSRSHALIIFLVALLLRGLYLAFLVHGEAMLVQPDTPAFTMPADGLVTQGTIGLPDEHGAVPRPGTERVPGYIVLLALIRRLFGPGAWPPVLVQAMTDAITCVLIGRLAHHLRPGLGLAAGLMAAAAPNLIIHAGLVLSDSVFLLPFVLFLDTATAAVRAPSLRAAALAGLWLGLATLIRPVTMYLLPVLPLLLAILAPRRRLAMAAVALVCGLLTVAPWSVRNHAVVGHWQLGSQSGAHSLYWLVPLTREYGAGIPFDVSKREMDRRLAEHLAARGLSKLPENPFDAAAEMTAVAAQAMRDSGVLVLARAWAAGSLVNLGATSLIAAPVVQQMERPSFYGTVGNSFIAKVAGYVASMNNFSLVGVITAGTVGLLVLRVAALIGLWRGWRHGSWSRRQIILLAVVAAYILVITGPITGVKYRLPLEPLLIILAAEGMAGWRGLRIGLRRARVRP